jgi:hypothetical protein
MGTMIDNVFGLLAQPTMPLSITKYQLHNHTIPTLFIIAGKLPVEVNMDWVPEFQTENLVAEPLPPPVPPKMIENWGSEDSHDNILSNHQMLLEAAPTTYVDDSLPVLPPKPKNWLVVINL